MDFIKDYGTPIVAALALVQPWAVWLYRRYLQKADIQLYPNGYIEIGYSTSGPTIALLGTLRPINREVFVEKMQLIVTRSEDKAEHNFDWVAFRCDTPSGPLEVPRGFMVSPSVPKSYNVVFHDTLSQTKMWNITNPVVTKWSDQVAGSGDVQDLQCRVGTDPNAAAELQHAVVKQYEQFFKSEVHTKAFGDLNNVFYWTPGNYLLRLETYTTQPDSLRDMSWQFTLSESDAQRLRLNVVKVLRDVCLVPSSLQYYFANVAYKSRLSGGQ